MRCLYCGKELALLKRLTGGGEFCSEAHKQSYQEEYNRLALSRLLQAQKKGQQTSNSSAQSAPPPHASVAVEEPLSERPAANSETPDEVFEAAVHPMPAEVAAVEAPAAVPTVDVAAPADTELEPVDMAGFLLESLALAAPLEQTPYQESWLELASGPAVSESQFQEGAALSLSPADLLALHLQPHASAVESRAPSLDLTPQIWTGAQPARAPSAAVAVEKTVSVGRLPAQGAIAIELALSAVPPAADGSFVQALGFENDAVLEDPQLLDLGPTSIDFPAEDADVLVPVRSHQDGPAGTRSDVDTGQESTPRASLEALSRLHQELREQGLALNELSEPAPAESIEPVPVEVIAQAAPKEQPERQPEPVAVATLELTADQIPRADSAPQPRRATELFEIPIRTFAPAKAAVVAGESLPNQTDPLLPNLKSLPLRPKVALARGYAPASAAPAATPVRTVAPPKPAPAVKPVARLAQPKQPAAKAVQPGPGKVQSSSAKAAPGKPDTLKAEAPKPDPPKPEVSKAVAGTPVPPPTPPQEIPAVEKAPAGTPVPPATTKAVPEQTKIEDLPSFELARPATVSWLGSLKLKLGIALVLLLIACVYFLGWGRSTSHLPPVSNSGISSDVSGPSIIMGEGGWVEGWGGDPKGLHVGRQITIYRPSLKLSDYRLEFEASIDVSSIGWVFRAADPDDYYAMKLMTVSNGLSPKVALFKYLVANGKQTQVGRVPIDLAVRPDTVFDIRVDVRGPQFTTFIQEQQVDSWTDDQLKIGGAGFLNEREERSKVKSVSIRYLSGASK